MAQGRKTALTILLTPTERETLRAWQQATTVPAGLARRARIILLLADHMPIVEIAVTVGLSRRFVYKWAQRFLEARLDGLADKPRHGSRRVPCPQPATEHQNVRDLRAAEDVRFVAICI
jgi:DNA-binding CsgD family transcriptional regulator